MLSSHVWNILGEVALGTPERHETMRELRIQQELSTLKECVHVHQIEQALIIDFVIDDGSQEIYLSRGSFGIVRLQSYYGNQLVIKQLLP